MPTKLGRVFILLGLAFVILGLFFSSQTYADSQVVRVAVVTDADQIKLSICSPYQIFALNTNQELAKGRRLWRGKIMPSESGIQINEVNFPIYEVRIQPSKSPAIYLNGRKFRGAVDIIRQSNQKLLAINHIDVEEYIQGVLYHEVAAWWPMEALKAQAIVARTFALHQTKVNSNQDYDLASTVYSQVYGGRVSERGRTSQAVRLTKDEVLTYKNKIFPAFYHAACAGHTEAANRLWKINLVPLKGRECQFCSRAPHFHWKKKLSLRTIEEALEKKDYKVGLIKSIRVVDRDISGRITDLEITSTQGVTKVDANRFRLAVGPNIIKSTNFTAQVKNSKAYFAGRGWGHGVGMCQWGAFFMSRKGFNAEQILGYYYPEAKVKKLDQIRDAQGNFNTF